VDVKDTIRDFSATKMEMTMRKRFLGVFVVPLLAALTLQAAAASEHHHARMKARAVAGDQIRNSNAYFVAPDYYPILVAPGYYPPPPGSYLSNLDEGAMTSGLAGH
jgi:hypothetical protein